MRDPLTGIVTSDVEGSNEVFYPTGSLCDNDVLVEETIFEALERGWYFHPPSKMWIAPNDFGEQAELEEERELPVAISPILVPPPGSSISGDQNPDKDPNDHSRFDHE